MLEVRVGSSIAEVERRVILATLAALEGDKRRAAEILGISLKTLYNRLNVYQAAGADVTRTPSRARRGEPAPGEEEVVAAGEGARGCSGSSEPLGSGSMTRPPGGCNRGVPRSSPVRSSSDAASTGAEPS
jgi:hypothetical protein